jgi:hypothetical protein
VTMMAIALGGALISLSEGEVDEERALSAAAAAAEDQSSSAIRGASRANIQTASTQTAT